MIKKTLYWLLDRLSENSTWRGIVGVLAAIGAFSNLKDPEVAAKFIATGMGLIALINMLRTAPPTGKEVAEAIKTGDTSAIVKPDSDTDTTDTMKTLKDFFTCKNHLFLFALAAMLLATPTFTGCKIFVNMPAETVKYYSFLDSWTISKAAYDGWCERVVSPGSTITKANEAKVDAAWNKFRAGFQSAMVIARQDWTQPTPATVLALQTELLNLIKTLTTK